MKKILMVCESFGGGVFTYVSQLCNDMCGEFEVYLAYSIRKQTPANYKDYLDSRVKLIEIESFGKVKNIFKTIKKLKKIEKDINPDIIHLHSSIAGGIGRLAYRKSKSRIVYTPHGFAHVLMGGGIKSKLYYLFEKILGKTNSTILTCCESEEEEAKKFTKNTNYIETGLNLVEFNSKLDDINPISKKEFTVFSLGRICVQKQPRLFNEIALLVPEAKFIWIGNGELENELTAPNIEITGWKPRHEALSIAKSADAFILCSLGEAIAMSLLENMYMKKICLVSNTMGNKSVIINEKNGFICNNAQEYADRIKKSMEEFPYKLVDEAYKDIIKTYNITEMKKKYINFYNKV